MERSVLERMIARMETRVRIIENQLKEEYIKLLTLAYKERQYKANETKNQ
jgi:hypothetical protein